MVESKLAPEAAARFVLGLGQGCTKEEVKKAFRRLALIFHPDKNKGQNEEEATKRFQAIATAKDLLLGVSAGPVASGPSPAKKPLVVVWTCGACQMRHMGSSPGTRPPEPCARVSSSTPCFCGHGFGMHELVEGPGPAKFRCQHPSCTCGSFSYVPPGASCTCGHEPSQHDEKPFHGCKVSGCLCQTFHNAGTCACGHSWACHRTEILKTSGGPTPRKPDVPHFCPFGRQRSEKSEARFQPHTARNQTAPTPTAPSSAPSTPSRSRSAERLRPRPSSAQSPSRCFVASGSRLDVEGKPIGRPGNSEGERSKEAKEKEASREAKDAKREAQEPKARTKPEPKAAAKPEDGPAVRQEPKPAAKPAAKPEAKPEVRPAKPEARPEPKPAVKPEAKPEPKPEAKVAEPKAKPEHKVPKVTRKADVPEMRARPPRPPEAGREKVKAPAGCEGKAKRCKVGGSKEAPEPDAEPDTDEARYAETPRSELRAKRSASFSVGRPRGSAASVAAMARNAVENRGLWWQRLYPEVERPKAHNTSTQSLPPRPSARRCGSTPRGAAAAAAAVRAWRAEQAVPRRPPVPRSRSASVERPPNVPPATPHVAPHVAPHVPPVPASPREMTAAPTARRMEKAPRMPWQLSPRFFGADSDDEGDVVPKSSGGASLLAGGL